MKQKAMESKRLLAVLVAAFAMVFALGLAGCGGGSASSSSASGSGDAAASGETLTLIAADAAAPESAGNKWQLAFKEKVESLSNGAIVVDYHGNSDLGGDTDIQTQVQDNSIQIHVSQPAPLVSTIPGFAVFDAHMTFATADAAVIDGVLNGDNAFSQGLQASAEENGEHILGWLQNGTFRQVTSNKELKTIDDYKGFQIRTMENKNHMAFWTALGAEPTPLAFSEVYISLQNGTIEGEENATDTVVGNSLQEVQKYLAKTNHLLYANTMVISKQCWDGLTDEQKATIEQAVQEATAEIAPTLGQLDADSTKKMQDDGVEVIEYDDSFFQAVQDNADVQKLNEDIDGQCGGLLTTLKDELAKAAK